MRCPSRRRIEGQLDDGSRRRYRYLAHDDSLTPRQPARKIIDVPNAESMCISPGCGRRRRARGLCATHYARMRAGGDPMRPIGRPGRPRSAAPTEALPGVRLPAVQCEMLRHAAERLGLTLSEAVREALAEWLLTRAGEAIGDGPARAAGARNGPPPSNGRND